MNKLSPLLAAAALILAGSAPAAVTVQTSPLGLAGGANAFIFNTANTQGGHSQGSVIVGGNWSGTYYEVRQSGSTPTPDGIGKNNNAAVYIGGDNNVSNYIRALNGDAYVAGDVKPLQTNNGKIYQESFDLKPTIEKLEKLSAQLFDTPSMKLAINDPNNVKVDLSLNQLNPDGLKVYTIDGSLLGGGKTLDFLNAKGDETIVINVTGEKVNWGWSTNYSGNNLIWNFEAKNVNIKEREFTGTLLATDATVTQSQNIKGTLIAQDWKVTGSTSLISRTFKGKIPVVSTPEPTALLTLGGFLGLALFSRSRRAARI